MGKKKRNKRTKKRILKPVQRGWTFSRIAEDLNMCSQGIRYWIMKLQLRPFVLIRPRDHKNTRPIYYLNCVQKNQIVRAYLQYQMTEAKRKLDKMEERLIIEGYEFHD